MLSKLVVQLTELSSPQNDYVTSRIIHKHFAATLIKRIQFGSGVILRDIPPLVYGQSRTIYYTDPYLVRDHVPHRGQVDLGGDHK
jgi:hypothetical protein